MNNDLNEESLTKELISATMQEMIAMTDVPIHKDLGSAMSPVSAPASAFNDLIHEGALDMNTGQQHDHAEQAVNQLEFPPYNIPTKQSDILTLIDQLNFAYVPTTVKAGNQGNDQYKGMDVDQTYIRPFNVYEVRKDFPLLQSRVKGQPVVWLDNAATSQKPQLVIDTIKHFYEMANSNIHRGNYALSMQASEMYEETRRKVARFIHANSEKEIVFVRGTTEGINLIANIFGDKYIQAGDEIIISMIEHHSNILPWQQLCEKKCARLRVVPVNSNGDILLEAYEKLLNKRTKIVAFTQVSNALGTVLPVKTMIKMAQQYGAYTLIDGAQAIPHFGANVTDLDCDFYVFSGHKMFGPTGIGIVYGRDSILSELPPWQVGGGMIDKVSFEHSTYMESPFRFEAGTGNIADVMGLGASIDYIENIGLTNILRYEKELMQYALEQLNTVPRLNLMGNPSNRVGVMPFVMDGIDTDTIGSYLDQFGIALRVGHHCAQPTMAFYGVEKMVRPSIAFYNLREEIDALVDALIRLAESNLSVKKTSLNRRSNSYQDYL